MDSSCLSLHLPACSFSSITAPIFTKFSWLVGIRQIWPYFKRLNSCMVTSTTDSIIFSVHGFIPCHRFPLRTPQKCMIACQPLVRTANYFFVSTTQRPCLSVFLSSSCIKSLQQVAKQTGFSLGTQTLTSKKVKSSNFRARPRVVDLILNSNFLFLAVQFVFHF